MGANENQAHQTNVSVRRTVPDLETSGKSAYVSRTQRKDRFFSSEAVTQENPES